MSVSTTPVAPDEPQGAEPAPARHLRFSATPWLLLFPAAAVIAVVTIAPIGKLIYTSFTDYNQRSLFTGVVRGVGLRQYQQALSSAEFWTSLVRTIAFTAAMVTGTVVIGTALAQLMTKLGRVLRGVVTVVLIFAWAMPTVASSLVWKWLFQPGYGVANWILTKMHLFGDLTATDWTNKAPLALLAIWMLVVWQSVPFVALTTYAAQSQQSADALEAARIDGAGEFRVWWAITWPFLRPTLLLLTILSIIWDYNIFNQIWLFSAGGPSGATSTIGIFVYENAFVVFRLGQGAAVAVISTALLLALTVFYIRSLIRSGEEL